MSKTAPKTTKAKRARIEIVRGIHTGLLAVYINGTRVAGEKPWAGGHTLEAWPVDPKDIRAALRETP